MTNVLDANPGVARLGAVTAAMADFIDNATYENLPPVVVHEARRALVSFVGTCFAGARDPAIERIFRVLQANAAPPSFSLIGRAEKTGLSEAIFLNAASANVLDFDDTHLPTLAHLGAPIWAVVLALCEQRRISGREAILAFLLGAETACRLGAILGREHYDRGWHVTTTTGVIGAAVAAARLAALDRQSMVWAIGIAANQAAGLCRNLGSNAKSLAVGGAARDGYLAAVFAEAGIDASGAALDGPRGLIRVMSSSFMTDIAPEDLGTRWEFLGNSHKRYPLCAQLTALVEASLSLRAAPGFHVEGLHELTVSVPAALCRIADRPAPRTGRDCALSIQHAVAVTLLYGSPGLAAFGDDAASDPAIVALRAKIRVTAMGDALATAMTLVADTLDGRRHLAVGSEPGAQPMSDDDLTGKSVALVSVACPAAEAQRLITRLWDVDGVPDLGEQVAGLQCRARPGATTRQEKSRGPAVQ
ncbi:MmgE/PrpD family protein [Fertoebacter nigrum]|uniref:MmgE/PrpD family protein n=1 Tax=Fertoeibacter niger TaxID=2656921 RepID=A0A8X8KPL2_9RHOB|nr:MmgE/PrpD family protein [Fertoeibacter niger]NUB45021.1 MmgE/PrpD family protein [Fertoeibacter niger]